MALNRIETAALALAGGIAAAMPLWLLQPDRAVAPAGSAAPLAAPPLPPPLTAVFSRSLFGAALPEAEAPLPPDAPQLVGIVGRIGSDAVAMVRGADSASRTLQPGEGIDGWTLESLAIDAAFFTRGGQRLRVPLPAGDETAPQ
ncbi:hypothetical protein [Sphingomonas sp. DT-204]|uniref:hypothetical protein n=1 Tax=Sphingomonas sp. DT-204 TaxID=3396166 RepID=UPI003F198BCD